MAHIDSQMTELQKNIDKAAAAKKPTDVYRNQKLEPWKQLEYLYDQIVPIVIGESPQDTAQQIWKQQQQIEHQRSQITKATISEETAPALPTAQNVKIAAENPQVPAVPKVGGFSTASIKAVADMQSALDATMKADPTPSLAAGEQHLLMLRFNLETHDYVMQSHTWLEVEFVHNN